MSTLLPIRAHHLSSSPRINKRSLISTTIVLFRSRPCFLPSPLGLEAPRLLHRNGVLARAEDKARGGPSSSSSTQPPRTPPNSDKRLQFEELVRQDRKKERGDIFQGRFTYTYASHLIYILYQDLAPSSGVCDPLCSVDETSSLDFEVNFQPKTDLLKALAVFAAAATGAVAINHSWVAANQDVAMALLFGIGYAGIIFEESLAFNKSGVGLLMAVSLWVIRSIGAPSTEIAVSELSHASAEVSEIVFFLLGAMTIVEIVDAHQGFKLVTDNITTRKPRTLLWVVGFVTFLLSSILDNLTSTIVMVSLLRKLVPPSEFRKRKGLGYIKSPFEGRCYVLCIGMSLRGNIRLLGAVVVIAANAGGAWSPIGDVTTTMLWIHGQISTLQTMKVCILDCLNFSCNAEIWQRCLPCEVDGKGQDTASVLASEQMAPRGQLVFAVGIGALVFVPVFKALTGLPPYMGMLLGLGVLWILTDAIHYGESERQRLKVPQALSRIDTQGALFFLGILLSVSSLEAAGILRELANYLDANIPNVELIASAIGLVSAIVDNVPLVAAAMGMYDLTSFPQDSEFWQLVAYCAGTGGSMLVIGSAAGVAFMGMEKVDFFWYIRKVSGFAFAGYAAGIAAYLAVHNLHISLPTTLAHVPFLSGS
ncbi:hypothetical protein RJ639_007006 [Escallonia herrerae]|uniref:Citrate transporter-like domain-containing protein n=1 Tax=Escallonia herrerae TaxID=1293975 RepID=A0AA88W4P3_9ASTE|nr:hypothetical protein RJ639_007006 [Escallonia herrerae]